MSGDEATGPSGVRYETKTVQAVRGTVARTIAKWEAQGWEVVSQSDGLVRTEITLRRAKRAIDVRRWAIVGTGAAVVVGAIVAVSILAGGGSDDEDSAAQPAGRTTASNNLPPSPAAPPATSGAAPTEDAALTPENSPELAAILGLTDYCSPQIAAFAETYRGRSLAFPASVVTIGNHEGASTRFDILLAPGDDGADSTAGPAFQFRDVNTTSDLHYTGAVPDSLAVGALLDITAEVDEYNATQCLFLLEPVQTSFR